MRTHSSRAASRHRRKLFHTALRQPARGSQDMPQQQAGILSADPAARRHGAAHTTYPEPRRLRDPERLTSVNRSCSFNDYLSVWKTRLQAGLVSNGRHLQRIVRRQSTISAVRILNLIILSSTVRICKMSAPASSAHRRTSPQL